MKTGKKQCLKLICLTISLISTNIASAVTRPNPELQLSKKVVINNRYSLARCNNGGAATYNYIPSTDTGAEDGIDYRKKWLVVLSGGGSCTNLTDCASRWNEKENAGKDDIHDQGPGNHFNMVPDLSPRDFDGHGILDYNGHPAQMTNASVGETDNPFRGTNGTDGFNRIWINYCSSDSWQGTGTRVPLTPDQQRLFKATDFDAKDTDLTELYFGGAKIVDAVIDLIMTGKVKTGGRQLVGDLAYIPDATDGEVVLAGSSAGGGGTVRNLDEVAYQVTQGRHGRANVKVWGIPDATSAANIMPAARENGDNDYESAQFYTHGHPEKLRVDRNCFKDRQNSGLKIKDCYAKNTIVVRDEISTPYFVVQQAYDAVIHAGIEAALIDVIKNQHDEWVNYPFLTQFVGLFPNNAKLAAQAYIRHSMTTGSDSFGVAKNNKAGLYISNYEIGLHQLLTDSERFFTTPSQQWLNFTTPPVHPGSPRLGERYEQTNVSIPTALANFRQCVLGNYGTAGDYNACASRVWSNDVTSDSRVINSTAILLP